MEIREMKHSDIEKRLAELDDELKTVNIDDEEAEKKVDEINDEVEALKERDDELKEEAKAEEEKRNAVMTNGVVIEQRKEETKMNNIEKRSTKEYLDAWVENLKGKANDEQRALLSENATDGTIAIPKYVEDKIWTDWEKSPILSRIRKTYVKGDYEVGYEVSATGAVKHAEGTEAVAEEELVIDYVKLVSEYIKKWLSVSRTVISLRGQSFVDYLYDEIGHQLAVEAEKEVVQELMTSTLTAQVTHAIDADAVLTGLASLSDEAMNPVVITNKATWAQLKGIRATTGLRVDDVFEGLEVLFNKNVTEGLIIADLDSVIGNFPNGEDFEYHFDEITLMTENKVRILGEVMFATKLVRKNGAVYVKASA